MTHDQLRKLAEAARDSAFVEDWYYQGWLMSHGMRQTDAEYVHAANPKTVLALLDRIAELEKEKADAFDEGACAGLDLVGHIGWATRLRNPYSEEKVKP